MSITILTPLGGLLALAGLFPLLALRDGERRAGGVARILGLPEGGFPRAAAAAILAVAVLLGLAATQPVLLREGGDVVRTDAELYVVLDTSLSMLAATSPEGETRFARAQALALRLRPDLRDVPIGVASLTDRLLPHLFPTADPDAYAATIQRSMDVENPPPDRDWVGRATSFGALSALATRNFYSPRATRRVAVVFTDGESRSYSLSALAGDLGGAPAVVPIVVHVSRESERIYIGRNIDRSYAPDATSRESLAALARATGGSVFGEDDTDAIVGAIRAALGNGDLAPSGRERTSTALAPWLFLIAALPLGFLVVRRAL